jgi:hypothetical protein
MNEETERAAELPPITDDDRQFLFDNPNISDVIEWAQEYARKAARAALASARSSVPQEPVAWLYEAEGFKDAFSKIRLPLDRMFGNPTEIALYACQTCWMQS